MIVYATTSSDVSEIYAPSEISYGEGRKRLVYILGPPRVSDLHTQSRVNPSGLDRRRDRDSWTLTQLSFRTVVDLRSRVNRFYNV